MISGLPIIISKPPPKVAKIALIFVATSGFLDDLPVSSLKRLEKEFYEFMDTKYLNILNDIKTKKELTEDISSNLKSAVTEFIDKFKQSLKWYY